jgi:hypothetical protein
VKHASCDRAKRVSTSCRNNGQCPWCRRSRTIKTLRSIESYNQRIRQWMDNQRGDNRG